MLSSSLDHHRNRHILRLTAGLLLLALVAALSLSAATLPWRSAAFGETSADLAVAVAGTVWRLLKGVAFGLLVGLPVGTAMGVLPGLERVLGPVVHSLRQVPLFGWLPLIGLWAGLGEASKVTLIAISVSYVMVVSAHEGVASVSPRLREAARALRLSRLLTLRMLIIPSALPSLLAGLRVAVGIAWGATVGAEILMAAAPGIGTMIWGGREAGRLDVVVIGTLVIGGLGLASNMALRALETRILRPTAA